MWDILRTIPACAATGQIAGVAAALCSLHGLGPEAVPLDTLRDRLRSLGALCGLSELYDRRSWAERGEASIRQLRTAAQSPPPLGTNKTARAPSTGVG
jgi:hypothetical protein